MEIRKNIVFIGLLACGFATTAFAATTVSFYAKDQHGSIAGATDANGKLADTSLNQYNDYGVNQSSGNASGQMSINYDPYQYSGEYTDQESGLQPLGNGYRYYDPSLMRFISPDSYPLLNLYAYGSGNPIGDVDPSGHISQGVSEGLGIGGAVAGDIGAGVGLGIAIMTLDPIAMLGAALGLVSAGTGGASTAISMINHQGSKADTTAETVLNVLSIGFGIGSAGIDIGAVASGMVDEENIATKVAVSSNIENTGMAAPIHTLPDELIGNVLQNLSPRDLAYSRGVCKNWKNVADYLKLSPKTAFSNYFLNSTDSKIYRVLRTLFNHGITEDDQLNMSEGAIRGWLRRQSEGKSQNNIYFHVEKEVQPAIRYYKASNLKQYGTLKQVIDASLLRCGEGGASGRVMQMYIGKFYTIGQALPN